MRIAGIMSGTSLDGIDVAVIDIEGDGRKLRTVAHTTTPYPDDIRRHILSVSNAPCHTRDISRLNFELAELYAHAVRHAGVPLETIDLIGCHGQTIYHEGEGPTPNTLQIGEAAVIAERLHIPVISNFRPRDLAAGGKGAPLVPFLDQLLFADPVKTRVALNIGGIANITVLSPGRPVIAFDTGPGNMVIDQLAELHTHGEQRFDRDGAIAATGSLDRELLDQLLAGSYFALSPPKTAGREQYGAGFIGELLATGNSLPSLVATATAFTAATIAVAVDRFAPGASEIIAAGGGVHNPQLMAQLAAFLPRAFISTTADYGIAPDAKEAIAFAVLAYQTWNRRPGNVPSATGAAHAVILGDLTWAN